LKQLPTLSKRNILVTGGSGFIGSNFINFLLEKKNYQVFNIDDLTYASSNGIYHIKNSKNYRFFKKNICNSFATEEVIKKSKPNTIVHFAAESHVDNSIKNSDVFLKTNVFGTHTLLKSTLNYYQKLNERQKKEFLFIHISTDEVFGHLEKQDPPFTEETKYNPRNPYSASKAAADHLVRSFIATYNFPAIILNCCNNFGPFQHEEKLIPKIINNIIQQKPIPVYGKGKQIREWIYVEDFAKAIVKVLQQAPAGESYNIGSGQEFQNIDLTYLICNLMDQKLNLKKSSKQLITFVADRLGHDFRYAMNSNKIKKKLKWKSTTSMKEALEKTINYYINKAQNKTTFVSKKH
jgi:dTDP-glucose 4,6-dehydratase